MKDLNLLRVFEAIWETRSVSKAADRLALTQPAVSSALARLREAYSDPLFTRAGMQMAPTAFCSQQAHYLLDALALVQRSLSDVQAFDPATSTREFVLGMRDIGEATLLAPVIAHCRQTAPGVRFHTMLSPLETTNQKLADGRVDLAVGFLPALEAGIHRRELFSQHYVCAMRAGHPLLARRLRIGDLARAGHIAIEYLGTGHALVERQLKEQGLDRPVVLRTPHYMAAAPILAVTDLVCLMPEMLARALQTSHGIEFRPIPLKAMRFPIALYWHDRFHRDPGNRWLRSVFARFHGPAGVMPDPD
jgi:DNA-binding transcriptional LysR family regulator